MRKRATATTPERLAVDLTEAAALLSVGKATANRIGRESGAVFFIGRRKLFHVGRLQAFVDDQAGGNHDQ